MIFGYVTVACFALFLFDVFITLSQEVEVIWSRKLTPTSWLYACARYGGVAWSILSLISPTNRQSCFAVTVISDILEAFQFLTLAWFSALRVYALSEHRLWFSGLVFILSIVPFCIEIYGTTTQNIQFNTATLRCTAAEMASSAVAFRFSLSARLLMILADIIVLLLTWYRTYGTYQIVKEARFKTSFALLLLRDGTGYFIIILLLNILPLLAQAGKLGLALSVLVTLFQQATSMLIYRFLHNLRLADTVQHPGTLDFPSIPLFADGIAITTTREQPSTC
ncbi:hypothetical protein BDW22DRAFT_1363306 [Trametopsis cervina]|nr:hypothetical protein BDW22DRAFT_1363306 [Trametopsis cervina]